MVQKMGRRGLLKACAGAAVVAAAAPVAPALAQTGTTPDPDADRVDDRALLPKQRIGIQLYTVRDKVASVGFARVFDALSRMGYREVEFAGYTQGNVGAITPQEIRQLLDDNGLRAVGSHVGLTQANAAAEAEKARILGTEYIGIASWQGGTTTSSVAATADNYNKIGEILLANGVRFYFHNHDGEFAPLADDRTKSGYLELVARTDPRFVSFEMDIFWAYAAQYQYSRNFTGGLDPIVIVTANRSRFPLFHVKDGKRDIAANPAAAGTAVRGAGANGGGVALNPRRGYAMSDVGQGDIPFAAFFRAVNDAPGSSLDRHYLNENDDAALAPHGSFGSAAASYGFMRHGLTDWTDV